MDLITLFFNAFALLNLVLLLLIVVAFLDINDEIYQKCIAPYEKLYYKCKGIVLDYNNR